MPAGLPDSKRPAATGDPRGDAVLLAYYNTARAELVQLLHQRDQALALFAAVLGVLVTAALTEFEARYAILFAVPYFGLGATFVSMQHDSLINALGHYCRGELAGHLHHLTSAPQWNESKSLHDASAFVHHQRLRAHLCLLAVPQAVACAAATLGMVHYTDQIGWPQLLLISIGPIGGAVAVVYSTVVIVQAYRRRKPLSERG